nr:hypothetical protein GCM10020063_085130 [Dactylosporangium thailandense]
MLIQPSSRFAQLLIAGHLGRQVGARTQRLGPTGVDVELLDAADRALTTRTPLAVVLPVSGSPAAVVLGAETVLRAALNRGRTDVRIAVASAALTDRALYDQLTLRGQRLASLVPRARISADGTIDVAGGEPARVPGRLFLTSDAERLLPLLDTLEAIIVDAGAVDGRVLEALLVNARRRAPVVYATDDPFDAALATVRAAGGLVWSWDATALGMLSHSVVSPKDTGPLPPLLMASPTLAAAGSSTIAVHIPTRGSDLDDALAALWSALGALARAVGTLEASLGAVRWAWGVFNTLALLPVTPARYDRHVGRNPYLLTITDAPEIARRHASHAPSSSQVAWASVAAAIRSAVAAAETLPREHELAPVVGAAAEQRRRCAVVVRNRIAASALRAALRESPHTPLGWDDWVSVLGLEQLGKVAAVSVWDQLVVAGTIPRSRAGLLAAPPASTVTVVACGPAEGARMARQAAAARRALASLRRETVEVSAPVLGVRLASVELDEHPADAVYVVENDVERVLTDQETGDGPGVWQPFAVDLIALIEAIRARDDDGTRAAAQRDPGGVTEVITVYLDEMGTGERTALLAKANDLLTRRCGVELHRVAAKSLEAGDTVVLVDNAARRDLRETISAKLAERPEYAVLTAMIDLWHERAALAGQTSGMTYKGILARMAGTTISSPGTIGNWVNGAVDGPADGDDITRFARAVGDATLERYAPQVVWALRTMHRVERRLGRWLALRVDAAATSTGDAVVDAELGVHVADLLDSITDHLVVDVDLRPGRYAPADMLGVVLPARTADDLVADATTPAR